MKETGGPELYDPKSSIQNQDDLSTNISRFDHESSHCHRQFEAPRPRAPGIEIKHAATRFLLRNMAVPRDHDLKPSRFRLQIKPRQIVENINGNASDLDHFSFRQPVRPRFVVYVAANGCHWRERCELLKNFRSPDIPGMNDLFRPTQRLDRFGSKQPVSIGNDADQDGRSRF